MALRFARRTVSLRWPELVRDPSSPGLCSSLPNGCARLVQPCRRVKGRRRAWCRNGCRRRRSHAVTGGAGRPHHGREPGDRSRVARSLARSGRSPRAGVAERRRPGDRRRARAGRPTCATRPRCGRSPTRPPRGSGSLDILVVNAGVGAYGPILDLADDHLEEMIDVNVKGAIYAVRAGPPPPDARVTSADLVTIASEAGRRGLPDEAVYCASKFAQVGPDPGARPRAARARHPLHERLPGRRRDRLRDGPRPDAGHAASWPG